MAVLPTTGGLALAAVDPWDVRSLGVLRARTAAARALAFTGTLTRERPTVLAVRRRMTVAERAMAGTARRRGVAVVTAPSDREVRTYAARLHALCPAAVLAVAPRPARAALALALATLHALPLRNTHGRTHPGPSHRRGRPRT